MVRRATWQWMSGWALLGTLALGLGCGSSSTATPTSTTPSYTVSGTVTFTKVPMVVDASGVPTGLQTDPTKFVSSPARGIMVRAVRGKTETNASGHQEVFWSVVATTYTTSEGKYSLTVAGDYPTYIEMLSLEQGPSSQPVKLIATDIASSIPIVDRPIYALRKGFDGSAPAGNNVPGVLPTANTTVDFSVGLTTQWWVAPTWTTLATQATLESSGTGSRIVNILDAAYSFALIYGDPTLGMVMNLHYVAGSAWNFGSKGSFVEFDPTTYYPANSDGTSRQPFGAIRAADGLDDAWNDSALYHLFARNAQFRMGTQGALPTVPKADRSDLQDLFPEVALLEGFSDAQAAILNKSPYLVTNANGVPTVRDIRNRTNLGSDVYSAATAAALGWEVALKANSLPSPGTPTDWANLTGAASNRFFIPAAPKDVNNNPLDIFSLYGQVARLKETKAAGETVDLATIFTDTVLTPFVAPFGLTWPRPTTGVHATYLANWGADPNSLVVATTPPVFTLSMANAHLNGLNLYPNQSKGEIYRAIFTISKDLNYRVSVQTPGGIPSGAQVRVALGGQSLLFDASTPSHEIWLRNGGSTTPVNQILQVRLLSPSTLQPDLPITFRMERLN